MINKINKLIFDFNSFLNSCEISYIDENGINQKLSIKDIFKIKDYNDIDFDDIKSSSIYENFYLSKVYTGFINDLKSYNDLSDDQKINYRLGRYLSTGANVYYIKSQISKNRNLINKYFNLPNNYPFSDYKILSSINILEFLKSQYGENYTKFSYTDYGKETEINFVRKAQNKTLFSGELNLIVNRNIIIYFPYPFITPYLEQQKQIRALGGILSDNIAIITSETPITLLLDDNIIFSESEANINYNEYISLDDIIRIFIMKLYEIKKEYFKKVFKNEISEISFKQIKTDMIEGNIDSAISNNMIDRNIKYNVISQEDFNSFLIPIPEKVIYDNEKHLILQGVYDDIKNYIKQIQKYLVGSDIDKSEISGYYNSQTQYGLVGDINILNYISLDNLQENFNKIAEIVLNKNYPPFARINLLTKIEEVIKEHIYNLGQLADSNSFFDKSQIEKNLPVLRNNYYELAKAVASQEQPLSFGNPSFDDNPNEVPFRNEVP